MPEVGDSRRWLEAHRDFRRIDLETRNEAGAFSFLWGMFETKVVEALEKDDDASLSTELIREYVQSPVWRSPNLVSEYRYFKEHFFEVNGEPRETWVGARFRRNDRKIEIADVLNDSGSSDMLKADALLRIVLRFRNNLFHGHKWSYHLAGQRDNFVYSNSVLTKSMPTM